MISNICESFQTVPDVAMRQDFTLIGDILTMRRFAYLFDRSKKDAKALTKEDWAFLEWADKLQDQPETNSASQDEHRTRVGANSEIKAQAIAPNKTATTAPTAILASPTDPLAETATPRKRPKAAAAPARKRAAAGRTR